MSRDLEEVLGVGCFGADQGKERVCCEWGGDFEKVQSYFDMIADVVGSFRALLNQKHVICKIRTSLRSNSYEQFIYVFQSKCHV